MQVKRAVRLEALLLRGFYAALLLAASRGFAFEVRWQPLVELLQREERRIVAEAHAVATSELRAEVSGRVLRVYANFGDRVEQGALLVELDDEPYQLARAEAAAALRVAEARLARAQRALARAEQLSQARALSDDALEAARDERASAEAEREMRRAQLQQAEWRLKRTRITAPFAGVIKARPVAAGDWVGVGQLVAKIEQAHTDELRAWVPRSWVSELEKAQLFWERSSLFSQEPGIGQAVRFVALAPHEQRGAMLEARFQLVAGKLPPGATGTIRWLAPEPLIPSELLSSWRGMRGIWVRRAAEVRFLALASALPGQRVRLELPAGWRPEELEVAVAGVGALLWQAASESR